MESGEDEACSSSLYWSFSMSRLLSRPEPGGSAVPSGRAPAGRGAQQGPARDTQAQGMHDTGSPGFEGEKKSDPGKRAMSLSSAKKPRHVLGVSHSLLRERKGPVTPGDVSAVLPAASQEKYAGEAADVVRGGGGIAVREQEAVKSGLERG